MVENPPKLKVLWLSDFVCSTGFAQVAHNVLEQLQKTGLYDFTVIGINHLGEPYNFQKFPFPIYPARDISKATQDQRYADLFGRQRLLDFLGSGKFDILFTLEDTFIIENVAPGIIKTREELIKAGIKPFRWIFYYPVDGILKANWAETAGKSDFPVTYTEFGRQETLKHGIDPRVINHGVDLVIFHPLPEEEKKLFKEKFFAGTAEGKFVVTNLNRNQKRKDIPRTIQAFTKFHKLRPNSLLYLHMNFNDVGGNIPEMMRYWGLEPMKDYVGPDNFNEAQGYPIEIVNKIYNVSDVVMSTTLGEGWGLSSTEAMATKTPIIFPNNSALTEIVGKDRGILVESGKEMVCLGAEDMNQYRPLTDVDSMVDALIDLYDHPEKRKKLADNAYKWVQKLSWDKIGLEWAKVFEEASKPFISVRVGRNDFCPCGSGVKYKRCCGR